MIAFAEKKPFYRSLIIQVVNKLSQVPSWAKAFEKDLELHEKIKTLHEAQKRKETLASNDEKRICSPLWVHNTRPKSELRCVKRKLKR